MAVMGPVLVALAICVAAGAGGRESTLAFQDVTAQVGLPTSHNALWGANWYDANGDGWLDLCLGGHFQPPLLFDYCGDQTFLDVTYRFPTDKPPPQDRHSFLFADFNHDGFADIYVVHGDGENHFPDETQWNELLYYDPVADRYVDVTAGTGLEDPLGCGQGSALFDFDGDGIVDLYKANTASNPPLPDETPCLAFRRDLAGNFTRDPNSGLELTIGTWGAPLPCDYDSDGDTDVLVRGGGSGPTGKNALLRNDGGVFTDVTAAAGLDGTRNNAGAAWGDYDNDGWMDLVIAHDKSPPGAALVLYHNQGDGTFVPATGTGLDRVGVFEELAWADFDNDGWLDLYVGASYLDGEPTRNLLYRNHGDGTFEEVAVAAGVPATVGGMDPVVALADYDRDGRVDIFTGVGFFRPFQDPELPLYLYRNVTPTTNRYLEIELHGPAGNELAIGSRVDVFCGPAHQVRQQYAGVGHHSQNSPVLHFGTGGANRAVVQIHWPNGSELDYCTHTNRYCVLSYYAGPPMLTDGPLVGAVTAHSAAVFARASSASTVQVVYSTSSDLADPAWSDPVSAVADHDFTAIVPLRDLPAQTRIYYDILVDGASQLPPPRPSFVTFPEQAAAFTVGLISDLQNTDLGNGAPAYAAMAALDPALVIQLGDFDHRNPACLPCMRQMHREVRSPTTASGADFDAHIARALPFFHVWDDHDLGINNADKTFAGKADALKAFQEYYPTPPLPNPGAGIWHRFSYGQAEFFMLDCRAERDPAADADGPDKSMLDGDHLPNGQKQWLLQGLLESTATWKFIISSVPFNPGCKPDDSWGAYLTERQEILDFIGQHNINGVVVISGDAHTGGAIDDGTHSGLPEISVPHTNLSSEEGGKGQDCPESVWSEGRISGQGNPGFAFIRVENNPDAVWLETYGADGTLRQSFYYVLAVQGACCRDSGQSCDENVSAADCTGPEDTWHPNQTCAEIACSPTGACCFQDSHCTVLTEAACLQAGGTTWNPGQGCEPNLCQPPYYLTVRIAGQGTVSLDPSGGTYQPGTSVTLTATALPGWGFKRWAGALSGSANPATLVMDSDKTVGATFVVLPPDPPSNVQATNLGGGRARIDWQDNSDGETGFEIQRQTRVGDAWTDTVTVGTVPSNVTTFTDAPGAGRYRYRVRACTGATCSTWSAWAAVAVRP